MKYMMSGGKMRKFNGIDISEAETMRYAKIQNLISLLQGRGNFVAADAVLEPGMPLSFELGRKIAVVESKIRIGKKRYNANEIKKVTINTEGSMAIYDSRGKKLCGSLGLNVSLNHIELFCVWVRKNNIPVEVVSGKGERLFQYMILFIAVTVMVLLRIIR